MWCGQKRSSPMQHSSRPQASAVSAPVEALPPTGPLAIRYLDSTPVRVRGLVTGVAYEFSPAQPVQPVDARDAAALLNTRLFRRDVGGG